MKINTFVSRQLSNLITSTLTGAEIGAVAKIWGYSESHAIGVIYGHFACNTHGIRNLVHEVTRAAILKAAQSGKSLTRYVKAKELSFIEL